jgi:Flp pilus assembly pilin Flp
MRRAQTTLEYAYLIGMVAAVIIATLVYIKRGFQGNLRQISDQYGAGAYAPGNTVADNAEVKVTHQLGIMGGSTTFTFGDGVDGTKVVASSITSSYVVGNDTVNKLVDETLGNLSEDSWD